MARGRIGQSAQAKRAKGNPGRRPLAHAADGAPAANAPLRAPSQLRPAAAALWRQIVPDLERLNLVRTPDRFALARYCESLRRFWELSELLRKLGGETYETDSLHGKMQRLRPEFIAAERYHRRCVDFEDRFGLTPAARQAILRGMAALQPSLPLHTAATPPGAEAPDGPPTPIGLLNASLH